MLLLTLQDIFDAALSLILIIDCKHYDYPHKMVYWGLYFINEATIKRKMIFLNFWKKTWICSEPKHSLRCTY